VTTVTNRRVSQMPQTNSWPAAARKTASKFRQMRKKSERSGYALGNCGRLAFARPQSGEHTMSFLTGLEERRKSVRHRLGRLATIKADNIVEPHFCMVSNVSDDGVRIHINSVEVPNIFVLIFPAGSSPGRSGTYRVVWRDGHDIGAEFLSASLKSG